MLTLTSALVALVAGHGSMILPPARGAIDSTIIGSGWDTVRGRKILNAFLLLPPSHAHNTATHAHTAMLCGGAAWCCLAPVLW